MLRTNHEKDSTETLQYWNKLQEFYTGSRVQHLRECTYLL